MYTISQYFTNITINNVPQTNVWITVGQCTLLEDAQLQMNRIIASGVASSDIQIVNPS